MKNFCLVIGTRPEIIKVAPFIRAARKCGLLFFVLHTGQHYSSSMDGVFWGNFGLELPDCNLKARAETNSQQVARMLVGIERVLRRRQPDFVIVYADVNTTLAGALAAKALQIPVIHLEAGLRSFDLSMPEEVNRVLVSHLAEYHFVPHSFQVRNLNNENIKDHVFVVGNTIADAIGSMLKLSAKRSRILEKLNLRRKGYFLMTIHRAAGVDNESNLRGIIKGVDRVARKNNLPVIFPIHPRTQKRLREFGLTLPKAIRGVKPLDYFDFLRLEANARLVLSDSGGIQEEACILKVPLVTLRENTERPETVRVGANILAGFDPSRILTAAEKMLRKEPAWHHPYGRNVSEKIVAILKEKIL